MISIRRAGMAVCFGILASIAMSGCTRVSTGNVGIVTNWNHTVDPEVAEPGTHFTLFKSIQEIDATQTRVPVMNMTPKDAKGVPLKDVDVIVTFTLNPVNAARFFSTTHEIDTYKDDSGNEYTTLGMDIIKTKAPHVMQEVTSREQLENIAKNITDYEDQASAEFKKELDTQFPGAYLAVKVQVNKFQMPDSIQTQVDAIAGMDAERKRNDAELALIDQRTKLAEKLASVDAIALRQAADAAHLTPEQVIAWQQAKAAMIQAQNIGGVQKVLNVGK